MIPQSNSLIEQSKQLAEGQDLEKELIATMLVQPQKMWPLVRDLQISDWSTLENQTVFSVFKRIGDRGKEPSFTALLTEITPRERASCGGSVGLSRLLDCNATYLASTGEFVEQYKRVVATRKAKELASNFACRAYSGNIESAIESLVDEAKAIPFEDEEDNHVSVAVQEGVAWLEEAWEGKIHQFKTCIPSLDKSVKFTGPQLNVIAARPSVGKTALAMQIAGAIVDPKFGQSKKAAVFSLEMPKRELALRLAMSRCGVDPKTVMDRSCSERDLGRLLEAVQEIVSWDLQIFDPPSICINALCSKIRRLSDQGVDTFFIDYFELIDAPEEMSSAQKEEKLSYIAKRLRGLKNEIGKPIFVVAQMNREIEKRKEQIPVPSDLRGTGSLEQDANIIMFIVREKDSDGMLQPEGTIYVVKYREGQPVSVAIRFNGAWQTFNEV